VISARLIAVLVGMSRARSEAAVRLEPCMERMLESLTVSMRLQMSSNIEGQESLSDVVSSRERLRIVREILFVRGEGAILSRLLEQVLDCESTVSGKNT